MHIRKVKFLKNYSTANARYRSGAEHYLDGQRAEEVLRARIAVEVEDDQGVTDADPPKARGRKAK